MLAELLKKTKDYVLGISTLQELEEWLLCNLQNILDSGDDRAADIANELDADLVEFTEGIIDESDIRGHLQRHMITMTPVIYTDIGISVSTDVITSDSITSITATQRIHA
jgi:hypothetical protein